MAMNGLESLIASLAILVAGGWAIYTFRALGQLTRSRAELQKLELEHSKAREEILELELQRRKTEVEIHKLEQEAKIGAVVEISIRASQQSLPNDSSYYISAIVEIRNKGGRNTRLEYGESREPFFVYAASFKHDGDLEFKRQAAYSVPVGRSPNEASPSLLVRSGGSEQIPFFFRVSSPGLYLLVFAARSSEAEQAIAQELGFTFAGSWVAKEYFVVK